MGLFRLQRLAEASSTNDVVKEALERGEAEGLAVTAQRQSGGYGRQGRSWASPVGAVAVRQALASLLPEASGRRVRVKWPNDVVCAETGEGQALAFRKLVGISLEQHAGGLCVGIGANVLPPAGEAAPVAGKNEPAYLEELGLGGTCEPQAAIEEVRGAVLRELEGAYRRWLAEGFAPFAQEYADHELLAGCLVAIEDRNGSPLAAGLVEGVDGQGHLLVREEGATAPVAVSSGEAHVARARYQLSSS